jgi:hypothetical protein
MPAGKTYTPLARTTLSSAAASVTFSSISGSYTDLVLVMNPIASTATYWRMRINSDSGTNYSRTVLNGSGTAASSQRYSNENYLYQGEAYVRTDSSSNFILNFQNYSNTNTFKTVLMRGNDPTSRGTDAVVNLWRSTSAITTLLIEINTGTFSPGSTFTLYGILAA